MSWIIETVFDTTIGWLVNKGRDVIARKLKEGDVTDQKIRDLIVREVEDIKSKLDGLSEKDLMAAVDSFETGIRYLCKALDVNPNGQASFVTAENLNVLSLAETAKTVSVAKGKIEKSNFPETTKNTFDQASRRFKMSRESATHASNNIGLSMFNRITAIRYRVMAAILESVVQTVQTTGDLSDLSVKNALRDALPECEQCLHKLNSLPAVQNSFKVELEKSLLNVRSRVGKDERKEIITMVCQINKAVFKAKQDVGEDTLVWVWPCVDTGEDKVDPLRDGRVSESMRTVKMDHFCVTPWSFGQKGGEKDKLEFPHGIATNTQGSFFIADGDKTVKVFDDEGVFHSSFIPNTDDAETKVFSCIRDVASADLDDKVYLLVDLKKSGVEEWEGEVQVYNYHKTADLQRKFPVRRGSWGLTISSSAVLVLVDNVVDVFEQNGEFLCTIGKDLFHDVSDIAATRDGRVSIVDGADSCIYLFNIEGIQLAKFKIIEGDRYYRIACNPAGDYVVIAGLERKTRRPTLTIYTLNEEFVSKIHMDEENIYSIAGITVTTKGNIAVALRSGTTSKISVV